MSGFNALTVYKIETSELAAITDEALKKHAFRDSNEAKVFGWTSIEDLTDTEWKGSVPEKGEFMAFSLRIDTRKIAAPVLKLHLHEALLEEEAKNMKEGKKFVSRERKKELKELHTAKLLSKAEPVPATLDVAIDKSNGYIYAGSTSKNVLITFEEYMEHSFKIVPEIVLDENDVAIISKLLRKIYEEAQTTNIDGQSVYVSMSENEVISLANSEGAVVSSKASLESVEAGLKEGLEITKMQLQMGEVGVDACSFTLGSDFSFSGIKIPVRKFEEDEDPDAEFLERMYFISRIVGGMLELSKSI